MSSKNYLKSFDRRTAQSCCPLIPSLGALEVVSQGSSERTEAIVLIIGLRNRISSLKDAVEPNELDTFEYSLPQFGHASLLA